MESEWRAKEQAKGGTKETHSESDIACGCRRAQLARVQKFLASMQLTLCVMLEVSAKITREKTIGVSEFE